jgi:hypothetical protein
MDRGATLTCIPLRNGTPSPQRDVLLGLRHGTLQASTRIQPLICVDTFRSSYLALTTSYHHSCEGIATSPT